jgi:hypothetical protein
VPQIFSSMASAIFGSPYAASGLSGPGAMEPCAMRKLLTFFFALAATVGVCSLASADGVSFPGAPPQIAIAQMSLLGVGCASAVCAPAPPPGCSQATAFLARNGNANATITMTLICGLVTDGTWAKLDIFYVYATDTSAHALLNWTSSSFTATNAGGLTFTTSQGFTGDGTNNIDTTWAPSINGVNFTLNSAAIGVCVLTSRTVGNNNTEYGTHSNANNSYVYFRPFNGSSLVEFGVGDTSFNTIANPSGNAQGSWGVNRTSSTALAVYLNGNATPVGTASATVVGLSEFSDYNLAYDVNGAPSSQSTDQIAAHWAGGGMTATDVTNIQNRLHTYLQALGTSGC